MEGRRRRAQRLTQNIEGETESLDVRQDAAQPEQEVFLNQPDQAEANAVHRRRQHTHVPETPDIPQNDDRPIPRLPKIEAHQTARIISPEDNAKSSNPGKRLSAQKAHNGEKLKRAADTAAKAGKTLLEGLGGLIVLVLIMTRDSLKKLSGAIQKRRQIGNKPQQRQRDSQNAPAAQEYTLEPVRPQDYHGLGKTHAQQTAARTHKHAKKKSSAGKNAQLVNGVVCAALLCVALFSAWQIGSIVLRSVRTTRLNEELSQQRAAIIEEQQETPEDLNAYAPAPQPEAAAEPFAEVMAAQEIAPAEPVATAAPDVVKTTKYRGIGGDALPEMAALYEKNRDLVAWIQIPDVLDLPVVYRNNEYYLTRDFNKQKNASGTIFLDVNHPFKEKTQNLLLHGHNMKDGTMFGRLAQYLYDDTYLRNHPFIYFDTLWNKEQYVIFAVLNVSLKPSDERFFNYYTYDTFSSDTEFSTYIRQLQLRSQYAIPIDVMPTDALLTLSTCLDEDRLVIVARRLRENETRSDLRALIRMATKQ